METKAIVKGDLVPLDRLEYDQTNGTRNDPVQIRRLAQSIASVGLLHALAVTEGDRPGYFRVVAGERRLRAIRLLIEKKENAPEHVPTHWVEPDQLETVRFVENEQREAKHPLDQAMAVQAMLDAGMSKADVALVTGETLARIHQLRALVDLEPEVKTAYREGKLTWELVRMLTQVRAIDRIELAERVMANEHEGPASLMHLKDEIQFLTFKLADAPWPLDATEFGDGPCDKCENRTRQDEVLFPDMEQDRCMNKPCWELKHKQWTGKEKKRLAREGAEIKKGRPKYRDWVALTAPVTQLVPHSRSKRTIEEVIGDKIKATFFEFDGRLMAYVPRAKTVAALEKAGLKMKEAARDPGPDRDFQEKQRKQREQEMKVVNKVRATLDRLVVKVMATGLTKNVAFMRYALAEVIELTYDDSVKYLCRALDWPLPSGASIEDAAKLVNQKAEKMTKPEEIFSLLLGVLLFYGRPHRSRPELRPEVKRLCQLLGITSSAKKKKRGSKGKPSSRGKTSSSKGGKKKR